MNDDGIIRRWPWLVAAAVILFLLLSLRSNHQLNSTPTAEFATVQSESEKPDREAWVRAYWECARSTVQYRYNYGEKLPGDPPPEFAPATESLRKLETSDIRRRYWAQLRKDWLDSRNWEVSYQIDFTWVPALMNRTVDRIRDAVLNAFRGVGT